MTCEVITFCDFAQDNQGKLAIQGTFDTIYTKQFPTVHPFMSLAVKLRFNITEKGVHPFVVRFIGSDGRNVVPEANGSIKIESFNTPTGAMQFVVNLMNTKFEREETIQTTLLVDSKEIITTPLYLKRVS
jgi:hypothetical protein